MSLKSFVAVGLIVFACQAARADLPTDPRVPARSDLSLRAVGNIELGNSWSIPVMLRGSGFDLITAEVTGAAFEPVGLSISDPIGWDSTWHSADLVSASGLMNRVGFDLFLTFEDPVPLDDADITVLFSAFRPGAETAAGSVLLAYQNGAFVPTIGSSPTTRTRSSLQVVPVPGAVFLGAVGLGLVGLIRKREI